MKPVWLAFLAAATLTACAQPSPEQQVIDDAAAALGGRDKVLAVKTLVLEGEGTYGNLGQDVTPEAASQTFSVTFTRAVDVAAGRARTEQTRTPNFPYFQGQAPQKQTQGIDGDVGYNVAGSNATRISNAAAKDRRMEIYHHPLTIVRAALDPAAKLANPRTQDNQRVVDVTTANGLAFTLAIDATSKLPTRVVSMTDNTNLGDVAIETSFADYQDAGGLKLPARLTITTDKYTTAELRLTKQNVEGVIGDLSAPPAAASAAAIAAPPPSTVAVEEAAKGIWYLAGQSHHSVLVEFNDHLMLIEAPLNDTRTLAVIAKAKELRPGKPLTVVINSHHHFDHSGGIRAAVAEGLTVAAQKASGPFFTDAMQRSHTIAPDALAASPRPLKLQTIDDEAVFTDGTMTVNVYHIVGSPHADTLLMAYFPKERLLVEADVFNPGAPVNQFAANLLENVKKRNLRVDRILPLHGKIAPYGDLVKAVQVTSTN
jgi:glyoxylase-like metal-dependent hydrolase (beta-lactamase superfamily II)